jgi:hypothetical protein
VQSLLEGTNVLGFTYLLLVAQLQSSVVQGTVIAANTGDAVPSAHVELLRTDGTAPQSYPAITAADGSFRIPNVRPGEYRLSATRSGYLRGEYGQRRPGGASSLITVRPGQEVRNIQVKIVPAAVISGRIYDGDGDPLGGATVYALKPAYQDGRRIFRIAQSAVTNDLGEYRLFGLAPGQYHVSATPNGRRAVRSIIVNSPQLPPENGNRFLFGSDDDGPYLPVYFPGVSDVRSAALIDLRLGGELASVDIVAAPVPMLHARGTIETDQATVRAVPLTATPGTSTFNTSAGNGKFDVRGLVPGSYLLQANAFENKGQTVIEVGDRDLENVAIRFSEQFHIPGRIRFDDRPPSENDPDAEKVYFQLAPDPKFEGLETTTYNPFPNGFFAFNVVPGDYRVTGFRFKSNTYLKSIRMGSQDILNDGLHVRAPVQDTIEIVIGTKAGSLNGTALDERRQPVPNATIVLFPDAGRRRWPDTIETARTDASGRFDIHNLPPGTYSLFAWDDLEAGAWQDPAFIRAYEGRGTAVRVEEGRTQTVEVVVLR